MDNQTQHIYFCADNKYIPYTAVTMASILKNADKNDDIFFHIIGDDITNETKDKLEKLKNIKKCNIDFFKIDPKVFNELKNKIDMGYLSMACFYRLLIPNLAPKGVKTALYLDGDMIIRSSLKKLFAENIDGYMAAVVEEKGAVQVKNLNLKNGRYFNSGMLLLNIKEIKKTNLLDDAFEYFAKKHHKFICRDQDILNGIWDGKVKFVEDRFNAVSFNKKIKNPTIVHFTGFMKKPWLYFAKHPYKKEWLEYLQMSAYKKSKSEMLIFKIKNFLSKIFFIKKDPTHKKYYIVQILGAKFGIGEKDDKNK